MTSTGPHAHNASWPSATFISDLHLEQSRPDILGGLVYFLSEIAAKHPALFILGDLFEVWLGDDVEHDLADQVATQFSALANKGTAIYLMHGNRDFLIGEDYAKQCHAQLIQEPFTLTLSNEQTSATLLLMHGDDLCTDDIEYMNFRDMVRNPHWQQQFLSQPIEARMAFARQARAQSKQDTQNKTMEIMDVNQQSVLDCMEKNQVSTLLHGHTHRPARHNFSLTIGQASSVNAQRIVLGDWNTCGWYAVAEASKLELRQFEFPRD